MGKDKSNKEKTVRIKLVKSPIGYARNQKATIRALGLHRLNQTVEHMDNQTLRGMLARVVHLIEVED